VRIRQLEPHEWALIRELRLRALADSPDAFARTLAEALGENDAYWVKLAGSVTQPDGQVVLVALVEGRPVGLAFGLFDRERATTGHVAGMWVDPEARGRGVGRALLESVIVWARSRALDRLELWVTKGNGAAVRLCERAGFADTGRRDVLASNPALQIIQMALNL
jgi:GNAT superfamily N-acetyltransferase